MSGELTIRPAAQRDHPAVARLLGELGRPAVDPEDEGARSVYARHLVRADTASLVAEVDGLVVGFLSLEFRERLNRARPQAWVPDLIVTEAHRRKGAGRALLARAMEVARGRGCFSLVLESGWSRHAAHQLYRSAGMADEAVCFIRYWD